MTSRMIVRQLTAWCHDCAGEVRMVAPAQAAIICGQNERTIFRWIESAQIHFLEQQGNVWVCLNSLPPGL